MDLSNTISDAARRRNYDNNYGRLQFGIMDFSLTKEGTKKIGALAEKDNKITSTLSPITATFSCIGCFRQIGLVEKKIDTTSNQNLHPSYVDAGNLFF